MTQQKRPPRIHDVAQRAGVSVATVSRVMSNPAIVAEATRIAVESAIAETGYTLNVTARNLRQQQVGAVLALVPKLANPFFSVILSGIADVLRGKGLNLLVLDTMVGDANAPQGIGSYLTRSHSDGVIVLDGRLSPDLFQRPNCPPVVQACEWIKGLSAPKVLADNAAGSNLAIQHLAGLGHHDILHLTGPLMNSLTTSRRAGVQQGLAEAGLNITADDRVIHGDFSLRSGHQAALQILSMTTMPTAVFCDNDEMAIGLMNGLTQGGRRVPQDISVVGFDNIEMSAYTLPPLTTIRQHRAELGRQAAETLLALIEGKEGEEEKILPVELVIRDSTSAHPG
ncbi:LacI family DNA-binding transcriptional regulator [Paracoccus aurantiacus]|uniref:LacI family DNA-binding transcriptional regulator n=1 Tax=Paracoccus aurantiacus TaxID=2599412 RepID=A0A5C6S095_9RHOB|nr:LacI family DNA-binding transcriptional regulator [Paracoccus aurantiacus]TXB68246.1 LacI family DNA-binding transcriptional regulator [Paracoccus aurantiacus]